MLIYFWFMYGVLNVLEPLFLFISDSISSLSLADLVSVLLHQSYCLHHRCPSTFFLTSL